MSKPATKEEKEWMDAISQLPCVICHARPVEVHHITRCGRRMGHLYTLPLCVNCHRGDDGFSGKNRKAWDKSLPNQLRLLQFIRNKIKRNNTMREWFES